MTLGEQNQVIKRGKIGLNQSLTYIGRPGSKDTKAIKFLKNIY
jgi:hypothetical protein